MAYLRMSMDEARKAADFDQAKIEATTEDDIRRQMIEDGFDPDEPFKGLVPILQVAEIRAKVGMSQAEFAKAIRVPLKTLRNWEQGRTRMDPAVRSLMVLVMDDSERAFRILRGTE